MFWSDGENVGSAIWRLPIGLRGPLPEIALARRAGPHDGQSGAMNLSPEEAAQAEVERKQSSRVPESDGGGSKSDEDKLKARRRY